MKERIGSFRRKISKYRPTLTMLETYVAAPTAKIAGRAVLDCMDIRAESPYDDWGIPYGWETGDGQLFL